MNVAIMHGLRDAGKLNVYVIDPRPLGIASHPKTPSKVTLVFVHCVPSVLATPPLLRSVIVALSPRVNQQITKPAPLGVNVQEMEVSEEPGFVLAAACIGVPVTPSTVIPAQQSAPDPPDAVIVPDPLAKDPKYHA